MSAERRILLPLFAGLSIALAGAFVLDARLTAEASYLAVLTTGTLLGTFFVPERVDFRLILVTVLIGFLPWILPGTADRGVAVGFLLAASLTLTLVVRARAESAMSLSAWLGAALGLQLLAHSREVLPPDLTALLLAAAGATLAALAATFLEQHRGRSTALLATGSVYVLGGGWGWLGVLSLVAAAVQLDRRLEPRWRLAAALLPLLVGVIDPIAALLATGVGLGLLAAPRWRYAVAAGVALASLPLAARAPDPTSLWWLLLLVPVPLLRRRELSSSVLAAALLGAATVAGSSTALLAPTAVVIVLTTVPSEARRYRVQLAWLGAWTFAIACLSAYPWLRDRPLESAAHAISLPPTWLHGIAVAGLLTLFTLAAGERRLPRTWMAGASLLVWIACALPLGTPLIDSQPVTLDAEHRFWAHELEVPRPIESLILDSTLANSVDLAPGTAIATVRLIGERTIEQALVVGRDSAEWAARRSDLGASGIVAPPPYLSWVVAGGDFFGQRYRSSVAGTALQHVERLEIERSEDLPEMAILTIYHVVAE